MHSRLYILSVLVFAMLLACSTHDSSKLLWKFRREYPAVSAPVVSNDNLYVGGDKLYCLNKKTGKPVWQFATFGAVTSSPVVAYGCVYFTCGGLYCLDAASGKVRWEFWKGHWAERAPVVADLFVYTAINSTVYCLDARQGNIAWKKKLDKDVSLSPIKVSGGFVYIQSEGEFYCLKSGDGALVWRKSIAPNWCFYAIANNKLYVVGFADNVYCVDGQNGTTIWHHTLDYSGLSSIALEGNDLYIRADKLYCLNVLTGALAWESDIGHLVIGPPVISGTWVMAASADNHLLCLDRRTGAKLWTIEAPPGNFVFADKCLYISSLDYNVYCISIPDA